MLLCTTILCWTVVHSRLHWWPVYTLCTVSGPGMDTLGSESSIKATSFFSTQKLWQFALVRTTRKMSSSIFLLSGNNKHQLFADHFYQPELIEKLWQNICQHSKKIIYGIIAGASCLTWKGGKDRLKYFSVHWQINNKKCQT